MSSCKRGETTLWYSLSINKTIFIFSLNVMFFHHFVTLFNIPSIFVQYYYGNILASLFKHENQAMESDCVLHFLPFFFWFFTWCPHITLDVRLISPSRTEPAAGPRELAHGGIQAQDLPLNGSIPHRNLVVDKPLFLL